MAELSAPFSLPSKQQETQKAEDWGPGIPSVSD